MRRIWDWFLSWFRRTVLRLEIGHLEPDDPGVVTIYEPLRSGDVVQVTYSYTVTR